jgi:hypothetical protein
MSDGFPSFLQQHFVPILATFTKDGAPTVKGIISAFVVEVRGLWFLITAGHCLTEIEKNRARGYTARFLLLDSESPKAKHRHGVPFPLDPDDYFSLDVDGFDYAAIVVPDLYERMMRDNGIRPLDETVWRQQPDSPEYFGLVGIPDQFIRHNGDWTTHATTYYGIQPVDAAAAADAGLEGSSALSFYGRISLGENATDISGVSGGPVFSFSRENGGQLRYWLHALQSKWIRDGESGTIAACVARPFIEHLDASIVEAVERLAKDDSGASA